MDDASRGSRDTYLTGLSLAAGIVVLTALVLWQVLDAGYHGGFEWWVLAMVVTGGLLVFLGLGAAWQGRRPLALGLVSGTFLGLGLLMLGLFLWVLSQMGG